MEKRAKDEPKILADYAEFGVSPAKTKPFYQQRGEQALVNTLDYFQKKIASGKEVKDKGAYLFTLLKANAGQEMEAERKETEKKAQERCKVFNDEQEERQKQQRLTAERKHLKTVRDVYLASLSEQQRQQLFEELKGKYEAKHGDCGLITELKCGFLGGLLDAIIKALPVYEEDKEAMIQWYMEEGL